MSLIILLGLMFITVLMLYALFKTLKKPSILIGNSIAGFIIFLLLNFAFGIGIPINIISIGIVALGGIVGLLLVLLLYLFGILL